MAIATEDFNFIRDFLVKETGIFLSEDKAYLVETRLMPVMRKHDIADLPAFVAKLRGGDVAMKKELVEAMTTNETSFYRDTKPFDIFRDEVAPRLAQSSAAKVRILCAACSSGQEPYSLAMMIKENPAMLGNKQVEIVGVDIDEQILEKARTGIYSQFEVQRGLPIMLLMKYFAQLESYGDRWQLKDEIKNMVTFQKQNLLDSFMGLGKFDFIFCRNVLIYFQPPIKSDILNRLSAQLNPGGMVMLGSSETVTGLTEKLKSHESVRSLFALAA